MIINTAAAAAMAAVVAIAANSMGVEVLAAAAALDAAPLDSCVRLA